MNGVCVCAVCPLFKFNFTSYTKWIKNRNEIQMCGKFLYYEHRKWTEKNHLFIFIFVFGHFFFSFVFMHFYRRRVVEWHIQTHTHHEQNNRAWLNANRNKFILILPKTKAKKKSRAAQPYRWSFFFFFVSIYLDKGTARFAHIMCKRKIMCSCSLVAEMIPRTVQQHQKKKEEKSDTISFGSRSLWRSEASLRWLIYFLRVVLFVLDFGFCSR